MQYILRRCLPLQSQADHQRLRKLRSNSKEPIFAFQLQNDLPNSTRGYLIMSEERRLRSITIDGDYTLFWLLNPDAYEAYEINSNGTIIFD